MSKNQDNDDDRNSESAVNQLVDDVLIILLICSIFPGCFLFTGLFG